MTPTLAAVRAALAHHRAQQVSAPDARPAAVALILVDGGEGLEALFIRRAERADDPWSGQVALPGGRFEAGDANLVTTAIRETREETGVDLAAAEQLGTLDDLHPRTPTLPPVVVRPVVFALRSKPPLAPGTEVQQAFWVALARLTAPAAWRDVTLSVKGGERTFPAYVVGQEVIWGMTERIVTSFLRLIQL